MTLPLIDSDVTPIVMVGRYVCADVIASLILAARRRPGRFPSEFSMAAPSPRIDQSVPA